MEAESSSGQGELLAVKQKEEEEEQLMTHDADCAFVELEKKGSTTTTTKHPTFKTEDGPPSPLMPPQKRPKFCCVEELYADNSGSDSDEQQHNDEAHLHLEEFASIVVSNFS